MLERVDYQFVIEHRMTNGLGYEPPIPHAPLIHGVGGNLIADEIRAHLGYMDLRSALMDLGFNSDQDQLMKWVNPISRALGILDSQSAGQIISGDKKIYKN